MSSDEGKLKVVMPELESKDVQPTVSLIDAESLELVKSASSEQEVSLPPGKYLVSSTLPTGQRSLGVADVSAGTLEEVELTSVEPAAAVFARSPAPPSQLESLGPPTVSTEAQPWFVRYLSLGPDGVAKASAETTLERVAADGAVDLVVRVSSEAALVFAQLAMPGAVPLNVALPVNGITSSEACRLTVSSGDPPAVSVSLPHNPLVDAVARYLYTGALQEAADVASQAEELLQQKLADPYGAALGGYALLRLHELARLHDWPTNLANWFPWLADGAVIAGEKAALEGDHAIAAAHFCHAARRGLPAFVDGFSMLVSRLREYAEPDAPPPGASEEVVAELIGQRKRLLPLTSLVDFTRVTLAFSGARLEDPAGSQQAITPELGATSWLRFDPQSEALEQ